MPFRDPEDALEDILENIALIERFVESLDEQAFYSDEKTIFSVNYALLAISEAARRLGGEAQKLCPDMPWQQIRGLGSVLRTDMTASTRRRSGLPCRTICGPCSWRHTSR